MAEFFRILILLIAWALGMPNVSPSSFPFPVTLPTLAPTDTPTAPPAPTATLGAAATPVPTLRPTDTSTPRPTDTSTPRPTDTPTLPPTFTNTATPTVTHTATPTLTWTPTATLTLTATPTNSATPRPSASVTASFSATPTVGSSEPDPLGLEVGGVPPAQKLPSALLVFPLVRASATQDTRIEIMNVTGAPVSLQCFYVASGTCNEMGFFTSLTANQPLQWMVSSGTSTSSGRSAPPFTGEGELKCVVNTQNPDPAAHNALQGRAVLSDSASGETLGYAASAFRRLSPGGFTGNIALDGITYEQCPERLHFHALASQTSAAAQDSELILVPCSENLVSQIASSTVVQFAVINEFEQHLSSSITVRCFDRRPFNAIAPLRRRSAGSDTVHLIVEAIDVPVIGLVIDRFNAGAGISASTNDPYLEGGRSASISMP